MQNSHEEEVLGKAYDGRLFRRLLSYLRPYRKYVVAAIPFITVTSLIELLGLNITMIAVDLYLRPMPEAQLSAASRLARRLMENMGWHPTTMEALTGLAALYFMVILFGFLFSYLQTVILNTMGQYIMYDLRQQI